MRRERKLVVLMIVTCLTTSKPKRYSKGFYQNIARIIWDIMGQNRGVKTITFVIKCFRYLTFNG